MGINPYYDETKGKLRKYLQEEGKVASLRDAMKWLNNQKLTLPWALASSVYQEERRVKFVIVGLATTGLASPFNPPRVIVPALPKLTIIPPRVKPEPPPVIDPGVYRAPPPPPPKEESMTNPPEFPLTPLPYEVVGHARSSVRRVDGPNPVGPELRARIVRWAEDFALMNVKNGRFTANILALHIVHYFKRGLMVEVVRDIYNTAREAHGLPRVVWRKEMKLKKVKQVKQLPARPSPPVMVASPGRVEVGDLARLVKKLCIQNGWASVGCSFIAASGEFSYSSEEKPVVPNRGTVKV